MSATKAAPFLRWAGGKRRLLPTIVPPLPATFDPKKTRFYEPFVGVGLAGLRDIWVVGGGGLAAQFFDARVLDRIYLTLASVFLTNGNPILPRFVPSSSLRLLEARPQGQFVEIVYGVIR